MFRLIAQIRESFLRMFLAGSILLLKLEEGLGNELTVRVDVSRGAPRLLVDGKPVRARVFFGGPGTSPLRFQAAGGLIEFEFQAEQDSLNRGTVHFRFGQTPGEVFLDDICVTDLSSGQTVVTKSDFEDGTASRWTSWPVGDANTVATVAVAPRTGIGRSAALMVKLRQPASGSWPDWHLYHVPNLTLRKGSRYRLRLWARAEPPRDVTVAFYRPGEPFLLLGGVPGPFESQIRMARGAGVNFVSFPIEMPWPRPGEAPDWTAADAVCAKVLSTNPDALLLPRFGADPPAWWRKAYPDDVMTWEDASQQAHAVVASPRYRKEAAARVAALVEHLESRFGKHMAGYHPCGQNTGEWFYQGTWERLLNGYAPADTAAWRGWLRKRYESDAGLQNAWREEAGTLDTVTIPSAAQRRASQDILLDPVRHRPLVDFAEFQQDAMADLVCDLARAARQASRGRKLVVFFYGYGFEFGPVRLGPATCGHYAMRKVLDCPDIDVLCSPISYSDRGLGGSAPAMSAAESVALAGKMWLAEDDTRTWLGTGDFPGKADGGKDLAETQTMLLRNLAQAATRNFATWWMDLAMTGWFDDQRLWDDMRRFEKIDDLFLRRPVAFHPQVAAVIDERSMLLTSANAWRVTEPGIYNARRPLGRMGAPYGQYLLDDVARGSVRARLWVFLNAWRISEGQRRALDANTPGGCRVWCYAPGFSDQNGVSSGNMQSLTGFRLVPTSTRPWVAPTDAGRALGFNTAFGIQEKIQPLFAAADATAAETLATYPDGSAGVALRKSASGWTMFVGAPGLTSDLLRVAAKKAGVHLFVETDCNVYANGSILALHAAQDGPVTINAGSRGPIVHALTSEQCDRGPVLTLQLKKGETRVLRR